MNYLQTYWLMSRVLGWSLGPERPKAFLGEFFLLGAICVSVGLGVFELVVVQPSKSAAVPVAS